MRISIIGLGYAGAVSAACPAVGIPIVSFDLSEARVSAGEAACYVRCDDTDAFAAAVSALLDDPAARRRTGEAGRDRIAGRSAVSARRHSSWRATPRAKGRST